MDISYEERQAVQYIIDHATGSECDSLRLNAYYDLEDLSHVLSSRILTGEEIKKFQYSIEIITRLDSKNESKGASFRAKRRVKLTEYYSSYDRSKGVRSCRI